MMANYDGREPASSLHLQIDIQELAHLIDVGYTRKQLSEHFDVSLMTIYRNISRHKLRKKDMWTPISVMSIEIVIYTQLALIYIGVDFLWTTIGDGGLRECG